MSPIWHELRAAARSLARSRGFAVAVVGILAVAVALQTSAIAVVNAYLLRGLPYPHADRLYHVIYAQPPEWPPEGLSGLDWRALDDVVEHPIAWDLDMFYMMGGEYPEGAPGAWVTPGFIQGFGIRVALGRSLSGDDFASGSPQVALISHQLWHGRFGGDSAVIGRTFTAYVSDRPADPEVFTIVGVLPEQFWHLNPYTQVLTPLRAETYPYVVRLRAEVPPAVAARRIERLVRDASLTVPTGWRIELRSTQARYTSEARPVILAVGAAVTLVFVIACANIALLMVLRGLRRRREIAVRLALGAGMRRVARLLLAESALLVAVASALGIGMAALALRALAPAIEQQLGRRVPGGVSAIAIDWPVLGLVGAVVLLVTIVLSVAPFAGTRTLSSALRATRGGSDTGRRRTRSMLVALEVAGSLALLVSSGLMIQTVVRLLDVDLGMRSDRVIYATLAARESSYPNTDDRVALYERLIGTLRGTVALRAVALSAPSPLVSYNPQAVQSDDPSAEPTAMSASVRLVSGSYFEALGIPIVRGREIGESDRHTTESVAILSASAARRMWPRANPIGRSIRLVEELPSDDTVTVVRTVVGVAADVRQSPTDDLLDDVYVPLLQAPGRFVAIVARADAPPPSLLATLRRVVRDVDAELALGTVEEMGVVLGQQLARPRFLAALFSAFGVFATTLGVIGLYAVIAYAVRQREHEIAVRMAVGADSRGIVTLFLRDGAIVVGAGVAVGVVGAVAGGRLLASQLFGVQPADLTTLVASSLLLLVLSLLAIWWPARRASRIDPVNALKGE